MDPSLSRIPVNLGGRRLGPVQRSGPVGRPTGNAVAERFILTLKLELIWARDWDRLAGLREEVPRLITLYNKRRPHQALDWDTLAERRATNLGGRLAVAA